jgi:hypothetical protein
MVRIQKRPTDTGKSGKLNIADYDVDAWGLSEFWIAVAQERVDFPDDGGWVTLEEIEAADDFKVVRVTDRLAAYKARKGSEEGFRGNQYQVTFVAHGNLCLSYSDDAESLPEIMRSTGVEPFGVSGLMQGLAAPTEAELDSYQESKEAAKPVAKKQPAKRRK